MAGGGTGSNDGTNALQHVLLVPWNLAMMLKQLKYPMNLLYYGKVTALLKVLWKSKSWLVQLVTKNPRRLGFSSSGYHSCLTAADKYDVQDCCSHRYIERSWLC